MAKSSPADNVLARRKHDRERNPPEKVRPEVVELVAKFLRDGRQGAEQPSIKQRAARRQQQSIESLKRYGGIPDLLLKEHPRRNFEKPPNPSSEAE